MITRDERLANERAHGKKISENAEEVWGWSSPAGQIRAQRRANYFIELGEINQNSKVLEIGCGSGLFTQKIFEATQAQITATDLSEDLLQLAKQKLPKVKFEVQDAMNLPYEHNSFDVIFGSSILHHLEMDLALKGMLNLLKPKGKLIFAEPNMMNPQILLQKNIPALKRALGDSPDETAVIRWNLAKQMKKMGFSVVKIFPYDFLHPAVAPKYIPFVKKMGEWVEKLPILKEIAGSVIIFGQK